MVFVGLRSSGGFRVGFNNSNSNSNSNNNNVQRNNVISLEPLQRNVYRVSWNASGRTHHLFLNPNSAAGLIASMHPGQGVRANTLNTILAGTGPNVVMFRHPTTREQIKRRQINKVRNPHYAGSAHSSPARRSPARRSPSRSPARRTALNRARSAGYAVGRAGVSLGRAGLSVAGRALGRAGAAIGRAGRMAVNAYRAPRAPAETQRNRNIARARRLAAGGSAMRGLPPINYTNNAVRRRLLGY